jgi:hypothetical protein
LRQASLRGMTGPVGCLMGGERLAALTKIAINF